MTTAGKQHCEEPGDRLAGEVSGAPARLEERSRQVDALVRERFEQLLLPSAPEGLALLAVGGFGRRQLFPHSDVDLLLVAAKQAIAERQRARIALFLQELWDRGLRVSHSVHTPPECCELEESNVELSVSLLDQRFLSGDRGLYASLVLGLRRFFHGQRGNLARQLCRMARGRHIKEGGSTCQLEPNIKGSPGGLRDYHIVEWLSSLREAQPDAPGRSAVPAELLPARDFLCALRCRLHLRAGRDFNLLTFDLQEELADHYRLDPADLMRRYYGHAREVHRAACREMEAAEQQASSLLVQFWDWRSRVSNDEFHVSRERVFLRAPHRLDHEPLMAIRLFQFVARHGFGLAPETERRIAEYLPRLRRFFSESHAVLWPVLKELFTSPHHALALRAMQQSGVLAAVFPEWEAIDCLVVRDFYHRYTVDEHTLAAIDVLDGLRRSREPQDRRFAELLSEVDEPALLTLAMLFHDLGKAGPEGGHVAGSVRLAEQAMDRIHVPAEQRREVRLLIDRHLDLSAVMTSRDLDDPATARHLAARTGTVEVLKKLTLVTYADISAVNAAAMTSWRADQLWRVYLLAHNELERELDTDRIEAPPLASPELAEFLEGFPVRYLRTHSDRDIQSHFELEVRSRDRGVALEIVKESAVYRLALVARDRSFLLASIAGALASFGMNILKAEGFANRHGTILDTFAFEDPQRTLELNPSELDRLRLVLERVTLGKLDVKTLLRHRPKLTPPSRRARVRPSVAFNNQASESATLIDIVAEDRPGLLYDLASAISGAGANIELILIDTEAHKALDVFYVTAGGRKLSEAEQSALSDALLAACEG